MKKKIVLIALSLCIMTIFGGCGSDSDSTSGSDLSTAEVTVAEYNVDDYVKLGDYKGLEIEYDTPTVSDKDIQKQIDGTLSDNTTYEDVDRTDVQSGDQVNINYEGKVNGETFEGGTDEDYDLIIGSDTFIPGFEDGLVGAKVGDTLDLNLTFPDNYSEDLAGKDVVFTVKVNSLKEGKVPKLTDKFVKTVSDDCKTVDEYKASVKKDLEEQAQSEAESYKQYMAESQAVENATVSAIPDGMLESAMNDFRDSVKQSAESAGVEFTDYLTDYYGMTEEEFEQQLESYETSYCQEKLVLEAISKKEGLELTDDAYKEALQDYADANGFESADVVEETYTKETLENYFQQQAVLKFLADNAKIVPTKTTDDSTDKKDSANKKDSADKKDSTDKDSTQEN